MLGQRGRAGGGELGQDEVDDFKTDGSDEVKHGIIDKLKMAKRNSVFCEIKVFRTYLKVAVLLTLTPCSYVNICFKCLYEITEVKNLSARPAC